MTATMWLKEAVATEDPKALAFIVDVVRADGRPTYAHLVNFAGSDLHWEMTIGGEAVPQKVRLTPWGRGQYTQAIEEAEKSLSAAGLLLLDSAEGRALVRNDYEAG